MGKLASGRARREQKNQRYASRRCVETATVLPVLVTNIAFRICSILGER